MNSYEDLEKIYRPSATIIIAAKDPVKEYGYDYRILLAKRTMRTAYAPDHFVFPGGVHDANADDDIKWLEYFEEFGIYADDLNKLCLEHLPNRPQPLMTNKTHVSRDISLRLTAVREAFEEVGLLLCLSREQYRREHKGCATNYQKFNRFHWQEKVHNDPYEFLNLCKFLDVVPDIWSLHEWSIWRSPPASLKKYDTILYIVALEQKPQLLLEPTEVEEELWISPKRALHLFKERHIWLPPLQFYELSRLSNILSWSKLRDFAKHRAAFGSTLLMLAYYRCYDSLVGTLPNDDFYPKSPEDHKETIVLSESLSSFESKAKNIHRLIYNDMYDISIVCNIPPIDNHLSPTQKFENSKL
uniref:Nudix hydrolase domain-containing protein n=1 Tax=Stomoxys calcitrans TaxID=35570 RepID=A0A1I8PRR9_STOCA